MKKILEFLKSIPNGVADFVINKVLFLTFGNKLKTYRTLIFNIVVMILAAWEFVSKDNGLFDLLCQQSEAFSFLIMFCEIDKGEFYAGAAVVITWLNVLLRKLTTVPLGYTGQPENYSVTETPKWVIGVLLGSIALFVGFIIKVFA